MSLHFDEALHIYTWHEGDSVRRLLSVTEILGRAGMVNRIGWTDEARDRGTRVHAAIALDISGEFNADADADLLPWVLQWRSFCADSGFVAFESEQRVCDATLGYAGTYDVRGWLKRPCRLVRAVRPVLLDIKTGALPDWCGVQLAGYARCLASSHRRFGLALTNERYQLTEYRDRADERVFLAACAVANWQVAHGLERV